MKYLLVPLMLGILALPGRADTHLVPGEIGTIQGAINTAEPWDTIIVSPGIYVENIDFLGKPLYVKSAAGAAHTTIEGGGLDSVVRFENDEDEDSILEGFTLTNGYANLGGGILCDGSYPRIIDNIIIDNFAVSGGGILCTNYAAPQILNNHIALNQVSSLGAGICCFESDATITQNTIMNNDGEGIFCSHYEVIIHDNQITGNSGAGIDCDDCWGRIHCNRIIGNDRSGINLFMSDPDIFNNMIAENLRSGVFCEDCDSYFPLLANNTFIKNFASAGGGMCCVDSKPKIINTIFWGNNATTGAEIYLEAGSSSTTLTIEYSNVEGGQSDIFVGTGCTLDWGGGMIDANPEFVESGGIDHHISYVSPCRDMGSSDVLALFDTDVEGDPRAASGLVDMGADEFHSHLYCTGDPTPGGQIQANFVGTPNAVHVGVWFSAQHLGAPIPTKLGNWYLIAPLYGPVVLGPMPGTGYQRLEATLPANPDWAYDVSLQGFIDHRFTNLYVLEVR